MNQKRIVFTRFQGEGTDMFNDLYAIDPDGGNEVRLIANPGTDGRFIDNAAPRYNKEKTLIAFLSTKNNLHKRFNIFFLNLADGKTAQITSGELDMTSVDWSPDDSRLVFSCKDSTGLQQVHVVNIDGSGFSQLTEGPSENLNPLWSPREDLIVFTRFSVDNKTSHIWIMDAQGGDPVKLTDDEAAHSNPSWSPDGTRVIYRCDLGAPHLRTINITTREIFMFPAPASGADASPVWSGDEIVFSSNRDWEEAGALFNLYKMDERGENVRRITTKQAFEYCGDW